VTLNGFQRIVSEFPLIPFGFGKALKVHKTFAVFQLDLEIFFDGKISVFQIPLADKGKRWRLYTSERVHATTCRNAQCLRGIDTHKPIGSTSPLSGFI